MIEENRAEFEKAGILKWHEAGYKGQGIRVAVLDSAPLLTEDMKGIPQYHPMGEESEIAGGHCASVSRVIHEVAPEAEIYQFSHLSGYEYVKEHIEDFDVINMSIGFNSKMMVDFGIPACYAAGNEGSLDTYDTIKCSWIVVGAWEEFNDGRAVYSNGGENLTCVGFTNIHIPTPTEGYTFPFNGTSCASPFVAGQLALLMSKVGKLTNEEAKEFIANNCVDKRDPGKDIYSGYGLFVLPDPAEVEDMTEIKMKIGSTLATIDGQTVLLDVAPFAKNGRTFVPIRFVAEALGCKVDYNSKTKEITITD